LQEGWPHAILCPISKQKKVKINLPVPGIFTRESMIKKTYDSENLPPAYAEAASRRRVAPLACLYGRDEIAKEG